MHGYSQGLNGIILIINRLSLILNWVRKDQFKKELIISVSKQAPKEGSFAPFMMATVY